MMATTILIVDDFESDRAIYKRYLQSDTEYFYRFFEADTIEEGVKLWRSHRPEIVLLDINLPDGNGLEFLEIINEGRSGERFPVIVLTGQGDERIAVRAMKLGAADYLIKKDITAVLLAICVGQLRDRNNLNCQLARLRQQEVVISKIALKIQKHLNLELILNTVAQEVRDFLAGDRAVVYQFNPDMSGMIAASASIHPWQTCLNLQIEDTCFRDNLGGAYREGRVFSASDIYNANLTECHIKLLEQLQVRANLVVPILRSRDKDRSLWGLLIVHQCLSPRNWEETDIRLLQELSVQLAIAIQQAELFQNLHTLNISLEQKVEERTKELKFSENRFRAVFENMFQFIGLLTPDGTILAVNQIALTSAGATAEDLVGVPLWETYWWHISLEARQDLQQAIARAAQGEFIRYDVDVLGVDGQIMSIDFSLRPLRDETGKVVMLIPEGRDISEAKKSKQQLHQLNQELESKVKSRTIELQVRERELEKLSQRLALSLKSGAIGCWEWDIIKDNRFWDARMYELFGVSGQSFILDPNDIWLIALHPDDRKVTETALKNAILGKTEYYDTEFRIFYPDRSIHYIKAFGVVVRDPVGNPLSMTGINFDISDRKQTEIQLLQTNEELMRATRLKDEFLANMSHELRTPLNAILGLSNALSEQILGSLNEKQLKSIATVESSGEHLLSLINDILDLSKMSSGMMELSIESVSIKNLCDSSLVFIKQQAFQKRVRIISNIPKNVNNINIEERRIRQVLINLLTNAVKFTPSEGEIGLLVAFGCGDMWQGKATIPQRIKIMNSPTIVFQVVDTGIGITSNDLQRLFQPFVQVDRALNRQYEGTGLGLALVKQIVELHGGQVMAESKVGEGSCFTVALPYEMSQSSSNASAPTAITLQPPIVNSDDAAIAPLILLAEDNEANIQTFTSYLTAINYRIVIARDGEEAVAKAKEHSPDIILMDIQMPKMDGLEAIRLIRTDKKIAAIPIIALTALAMEGDRERCLDAGANDYLSKPIKFRQLNAKIQQILKQIP
ncbi:MAG: hypothetical protein DCF19_16560 [Pseudanabaena frigida]|uniref:Circadian input-output histidine kinase CikA n=1 Tax=Pseudanabaena frigida TaxID=945775 RepID=A0A2W4XRZ9_9CYAN|nr:MAG: hypothetical protein DCF19_16560 [Pseudanabaena frigida]